jgi:hypothetical protein
MPFGLERSPDLPALHGQVIQAPALHVHQLDDHIIASHTLEEHQDQLRQFFTILQENSLQMNPVCVCSFSCGVPGSLHRQAQCPPSTATH